MSAELTNHFRLLDALQLGTARDVAHALIYYEVRNPTIADNVMKKLSSMQAYIDERLDVKLKVQEALNIRKARLGDALWFSRF